MFASFLLSLREGLEAALLIGILIGALYKMGRPELKRPVWIGAISAVVVSLVVGVMLYQLGALFEGDAEKIFEGITMLSAAAVLTWMIFWMNKQARDIKGNLESDVNQAVQKGAFAPLFLVAFLVIIREGIELALFLTAAAYSSSESQVLLGAVAGLIVAVVLGWLLYSATSRLNLRRFFQVTGILLLLFAAGLVAHGIHEFNEVGWVPAVIDPLWNMNHILDEKSTLGEMLKALFGYNGNPSLTETGAYWIYIVVVFLVLQWTTKLIPLPTWASSTVTQKSS